MQKKKKKGINSWELFSYYILLKRVDWLLKSTIYLRNKNKLVQMKESVERQGNFKIHGLAILYTLDSNTKRNKKHFWLQVKYGWAML